MYFRAIGIKRSKYKDGGGLPTLCAPPLSIISAALNYTPDSRLEEKERQTKTDKQPNWVGGGGTEREQNGGRAGETETYR